ncbi:unnamed protein product [Candida verbasci]|uniref:Uracil-DNA glycosylase n=1 Tax=Candida verbasci TaxID=1227364 RepID=A0A9W4TX30_9ASCO|nr:unnamed protein product [Candida verbasci]
MSKRVLITDFFSNKQIKKHKKEEVELEITTIESKENTVIDDWSDFCKKHNFNKQEWLDSLSTEEKELLDIEIKYLHITWLAFLHKELTKSYFLNLKRFLNTQFSSKTIFPPINQIYTWSNLTPLPNIKCLILGQDPYHNLNQAHGLAFSVLEPTKPPPSLVNIYKTIKNDFPDFEVPDYKQLVKNGTPGGGNLTKWAKNGVLMLNAVLTVEAHKANSHAQKGWEQFTEQVIQKAIEYHSNDGFVIMAWGSPAQKRISKFNKILTENDHKFLILKTVHPSPLSAHKGFMTSKIFKTCNEWLSEHEKNKIDWGIIDGNEIK